jgi:transcription elongation factor GreA
VNPDVLPEQANTTRTYTSRHYVFFGTKRAFYSGVGVVATNMCRPCCVVLVETRPLPVHHCGVAPNTRPDQHVPEPRAAPDAGDVGKDASGHAGLSNEQRLEAERRKLREREQRLIASFGDRDITSDRADQAQLLEGVHELQWVRDRIAEISQLLADLRQPREQLRSGQIGIGATVDLEFPDGSHETIWLGSPGLAHADEAVVTPSSPLGQALLGHRAGDTVDYTTPAGPQRVRVLAVRSAPLGSEAATTP